MPYRTPAPPSFLPRASRRRVDRLATHLRAITYGTVAVVVALAYVLGFIGRNI